jgi:hypothetical protein
MANRIGGNALAVWTTGLWIKEAMFLRFLEKGILRLVLRYRKWRKPDNAKQEASPSPFIKQERKVSRRDVAQATLPSSWYIRLPKAALLSSWNATQWVWARLIEGDAVRKARRDEQKHIDIALGANDSSDRGKGGPLSSLWGLFQRRRNVETIGYSDDHGRANFKPRGFDGHNPRSKRLVLSRQSQSRA